MREYNLIDAFNLVSESFSFLSEEWKFEKIREDNINYGCYFEYKKNNLVLHIGYEYKDNFFYFEFVLKGERVPFITFFKEREPNLDWRLFEPDDFQYRESLIRNVEYLKKYEEDVMKMTEL